MPAFIKIPNPIRVDKLTEIMRIRGVSVYVHWTVFLVAAAMIAGAVEGPVLTLAASISCMGVMLIHECGHMVAAQRLGCRVSSIELYPIFGVTHFETPWSRFDHCVIAWGGVIAQAIVAFPVIIWITVSCFRLSPWMAQLPGACCRNSSSACAIDPRAKPKLPADGDHEYGFVGMSAEAVRLLVQQGWVVVS